MKNLPLHPLLGIGLGLLAMSTASIFIRYAQASGAPSLVIAAYRLTIATLVLAPLALTRHRTELQTLTRRQITLALVAGVFLALHFGTWISSLAYTSVVNSAVLVSTSPLFVALIAALVLRERLARALVVGMGVAMLGGSLVAVSAACPPTGCPPGQAATPLGDGLALTGAAAMAVYFTVGQKLRAGLSLITYIFLTYGIAALTLMLTVLVSGLPLWPYPAETYLWFAALALVPQLIGHSSLNWALRYLPATYVAITVLGEPMGSTLLALWLLGETPAPLKLFGGALILAGIGLAARPTEP